MENDLTKIKKMLTVEHIYDYMFNTDVETSKHFIFLLKDLKYITEE